MRWLVLVLILAVGADAAAGVTKPANWLGDLVFTSSSLALGTAGKVLLLDPKEAKLQGEIPCPAGQVQALAWSEERSLLAAAGWDFVCVWSGPDFQIYREFLGLGTMVKCLAFAPGGELLLTGCADGRVFALDLEQGEVAWAARAHPSTVWGLAIAKDGELWATAGNDRVALWSLGSGKEVRSFPGKGWDVDFSGDSFLLAAGMGKILKVWDVAVGLPFLEVWAHDSCTTVVTFSPDGSLLATGSLDQTAKVWDVWTGERLGVWEFPAVMAGIGFSRDGCYFAAASEDGTLILVSLPLP